MDYEEMKDEFKSLRTKVEEVEHQLDVMSDEINDLPTSLLGVIEDKMGIDSGMYQAEVQEFLDKLSQKHRGRPFGKVS